MSRFPGSRRPQHHAAAGAAKMGGGALGNLPPLKCPGGQRTRGTDIVNMYKVPNQGFLAKYDLRFIINLALTHRLMKKIDDGNKAANQLLVELGPGPGTLTRSLLTRPCRGVFGIEIDNRFNPLLNQVESETNGKFKWANADVLKIDEFEMIKSNYPEFAAANERIRPSATGALGNDKREEFAQEFKKQHASIHDKPVEQDASWWNKGVPPIQLIGNLPFAFSTHLALRYAVDCYRKQGLYKFGMVPAHLFFQKELAERIVAVPDHPNYNNMSIVLQNYFNCRIRKVFREVVYFPQTEVLGAMVTLTPRPVPLVDVDAAALMHFSKLLLRPQVRQKGLLYSLKKIMPDEVALYVLRELRLDGALLVYQVSVTDVAKMALLWVRYLEASNQTAPGEMELGDLETIFDKEEQVLNYDFEERQYERYRQEMNEAPTW